MEKAKEETREARAQEEQFPQAVDKSVNVNLRGQGLDAIPDDAVEFFKPDVERYGSGQDLRDIESSHVQSTWSQSWRH